MKWQDFGANEIHAELLKPELLKPFCMIIIMIPLMLCFPNFLTFVTVSHGVSKVFLQFLWVFYCFPSVFPLIPILDFVSKYCVQCIKPILLSSAIG